MDPYTEADRRWAHPRAAPSGGQPLRHAAGADAAGGRSTAAVA